MAECVDVMADALATLARGDAVLPLRNVVSLPDRSGRLGLMPGYLGSPARFGVKIVSLFPGNHGTPYDSHQGAVLLFDPRVGSVLTVIDAASITAIRTAGVSGVATRLLARPDAGDLAILGSGVQAATHLEAMRAVRGIRRVRVWSRDSARARRFAERESERQHIDIEATPSAREAVEGANLVCTTTASSEPVLEGAWIAPGAHINAVGACVPTSRELDTAAVLRSRLYVDRRESALAEAGDILIPIAEGAFGEEHIVGELGDVLIRKAPGRGSAREITLFKSLGIAIEDLAAAQHVLDRAIAQGAGMVAPLGAMHDAPA
ncbi:MAG TPA: ornithine cyclodeaminase family protein, partial [Candidatus Eisenbacteria bacterium]|nr:ornithine cyclodeaminase family protein [Candidatus Eisenbacteria bacterium]